MKIIDCKQGSTEWSQARLGVVTASEIDALVTPLFKIKSGQGVQTYLYQKLAERIMGYAGKSGGTWAMDQGNIIETVAVPWYEFANDVEVRRVGFCLADDGKIGCSPDGLVGDDGGLEVKSPQPPRQIEYLLDGVVPTEYMPQIQMSLYVTGRAWWDFVSFHRFLPPIVIRVLPDDKAQAAIETALDGFTKQFDAAYERIAAMMAQTGRGE